MPHLWDSSEADLGKKVYSFSKVGFSSNYRPRVARNDESTLQITFLECLSTLKTLRTVFSWVFGQIRLGAEQPTHSLNVETTFEHFPE